MHVAVNPYIHFNHLDKDDFMFSFSFCPSSFFFFILVAFAIILYNPTIYSLYSNASSMIYHIPLSTAIHPSQTT